jgi:titin
LVDLNGAGFLDVAAGASHTCVLLAESNATSSSSVSCFGDNQIGQLGLGDTANRGASALTMGLGLGLSLTPSRTYFPVSDNSGTLTAATLTNVMVGVPHTFRMLAGNAAGNSQWSLGTTVMMVGTATAPNSLTVLRRTGSSITLVWTSPSDPGSPITDYKVQTSTDGTNWTDYVPASPIGISTQAEVTGLTGGVTTYFRVAASNALGLGDWSNVINSIPMDRPSAPVAPIVTDVHNNTATVSWSAPTDNGSAIVDYVVEYRQAISGSGWEAPIVVPASSTSTSITGLVPNLLYEVRVTARNHAAIDPTQLASSDPSALTQFTTKVGAPVVSAITLSVSGLSPYTSNARFSWTAPAPNGGAGAIGSYTVQYRLHDTIDWTSINVGNQLAYTVPAALVPGATYDLQIYATTVNGDGPAASSTFVAKAVPADAPTGLNVGATTAGGAHLQWTAPVNNGGANITDYRVEWSTDGGTSWHIFNHPVSAATSIYVSGLAANAGYIFRVSALNSAGSSTTSVTASGTTRLVPSPISGLVTSVVHGTEVLLSWIAPATPSPVPANYSPVSDYRVEVSTDGIHYSYFNHDASPSSTMMVTGLSLATDYWMRVSSFNGAYSAASQPIALTTTNVAGAPTAVRATPRGTGAIVSWTPPLDDGGEPISDYSIRYRVVGAANWTSVTHSPSATTNYIVLGLVHTTVYEVQVAAVNVNGAGDWSASAGFRTLAVAPGAPTGIAALAGNAAIQASWVAPADNGGANLTQFEVQRRLVGGVWATGGTVNGATAKLLVVQRLRNGSRYELRVRARNAAGWGPYSTSVVATTKLVPVMPAKPLVLARNQGVLISWLLPGDTSPAQKPTRVLVQRSTNGTTWTTVYSVLPIVQQVPVIGLTNGVAYQFRLVSVNALGQSIPSPVSIVSPRA